MRFMCCIALSVVAYLSSCATSLPAVERVTPEHLTGDRGLLIVQFLHIGVNKEGEPYFDYMEGFYPRMTGDSVKNFASPLEDNGIGIYPFPEGNYELERLREITRSEDRKYEYTNTLKYPIGLPVSLKAQTATNMGMILLLEDMDTETKGYRIIPVDNEHIVSDYLKNNFADAIPETFDYQLTPQLNPFVKISELREYLVSLYGEAFIGTIPELN